MALSFCFHVRLKPLCRVQSVAVFVHKGPRSNDGLSWGDKRPRRNYGPPADELGDISALYCDEPIVGDSSVLVNDCTMHIKNFIYNRNIRKAHHLLDLMIEKDVPPNEQTYIALMKGYSRTRRNDVVFELLNDMGNRGVMPTEKTLHVLTNACTKTGDIVAALSFFNKLKTEYTVEPNTVSYNLLLKTCVKKRNLKAAESVLEHMASLEVSKDVLTLTIMINVYAVCCNKHNAKQFLEECRDLVKELDKDGVKANVLTFNTLLKLCARGGLTTEALDLLDELKTKDMSPDVVTYATLIDGISKNETLPTEEVLRVSSNIIDEMKKESLQLNAQAYTVLMNLAFKTRDLNRAVSLFQEMKELGIKPTVETYGSMIKHYTKLGDPSTGDEYLKPCFDLLEECENEGIKLDTPGYVSLLGACANAANLNAALKLWRKINEQEVAKTVSIYTAMINVYISVEDSSGAVSLFTEMKREGLKPSVITYGTMIKCHAKLGDPASGDAYLKSCLDLLEECEQCGIKMSEPGYLSLLRACANVSNINTALEIWKKIDEQGVVKDVFLYTAVITVYISVDDLSGAVNVFSRMKREGIQPSVVTYSIMIKCYAKLGDPTLSNEYLTPCLELLEECENEGIRMNAPGYVPLLSACANAANLNAALKLWRKIDEQEVAKTVSIYTAMINVYISVEDSSGAVSLFTEMKREGIKPNAITYNTMIKCYEKLGDPYAGDVYLKPCLNLLTECEKEGLVMGLEGYTSILSACANVANVETALEIWKKIEEQRVARDVIQYNAMINVYISVKDTNGAVKLFTQMKSEGVRPTVVTYGTMIKCYEKLGDPATGDAYLKPCLDLINECEKTEIAMKSGGYISLLNACANAANFDIASEIWKKINARGLEKDVFLYTAMMAVYISVDDLSGAVSLFREMKREGLKPSVITYGTMIKCHAKLGDPSAGDAYLKPCLDLLEECEQEGLIMGLEGYTSILSACANVANIGKALEIWSKMIEVERELNVFVYTAMISVCLNADREENAFAFFDEMKTSGVEPNEVTYTTFVTYFIEKKDRAGVRKILDELKAIDMHLDKHTLRKLKALQLD